MPDKIRIHLPPHADDSAIDTAILALRKMRGLGSDSFADAILDMPAPGVIKALKPGGPAHLGMDVTQVSARKRDAIQESEHIRSRLVDRLLESKDAWAMAVHHGAIAAQAVGIENISPGLAVIRKPIERQARGAIRTAYVDMFLLGKKAGGNFLPITDDERRQIIKLHREEQLFFANMLDDIEHGTYQKNLTNRVKMYGNAIQEAFWAGFVLSDLSHDRWLQWKIDSDAEHCSDCAKLSKGGRYGKGIYRALELSQRGLFPGSGKLKCCTNCRCTLVEVNRPAGKPLEDGVPLKDIKIEGTQSASFSGNGREGREKYTRRSKRYKWNWKKR